MSFIMLIQSDLIRYAIGDAGNPIHLRAATSEHLATERPVGRPSEQLQSRMCLYNQTDQRIGWPTPNWLI